MYKNKLVLTHKGIFGEMQYKYPEKDMSKIKKCKCKWKLNRI